MVSYPQPKRISRESTLKIAGIAAVAVLTLVVALVLRSRWRAIQLQPSQLTSNSAEAPVIAAAISPDGKYLAYSDGTGVYLQSIGSGDAQQISAAECKPNSSSLMVSQND